MRKVLSFFRRVKSKASHKHDWDRFSYGKRRCRVCGQEDWLFSNPYPDIGEPKLYWKKMWPLEGRL